MTTMAQGRSKATPVLLSAAMLAAIVFWFGAAVPYFTTHRESFGRVPELFWERRVPQWIHIAGGTAAMFLGPVQIWLGETPRRLALHRTLGFAYLGGVAVTCGSGFYMSLTTPVGFVYASGLFGMALACAVCTLMAYVAIVRRNFAQHREWMIRSYVVIVAFVFFRLIVVGLEAAAVGGSGPQGDAMRASLAAWASWAFPLLATEVALQMPKLCR